MQGENKAGGNAGEFFGSVQINGGANVTGNVQINGVLDVTSNSPMHSIKGALSVDGDLATNQNLHVKDSLLVTGTGSHTIAGTLNVGVDVVLANQDCAEDFDIGLCTNVEPGTVMALDEQGLLQESRHAYDKKVAGVISGAGKFKPGLILGREKGQSDSHRAAVALMGKVYCKVDAQFGDISVGDLLTTSDTPGHAMRADDPLKAFGSVIGKALKSMSAGQRGLIPILVALQ